MTRDNKGEGRVHPQNADEFVAGEVFESAESVFKKYGIALHDTVSFAAADWEVIGFTDSTTPDDPEMTIHNPNDGTTFLTLSDVKRGAVRKVR